MCGDIRGGPGQQSPRRRGVPAESLPEGPIVFEGGKNGAAGTGRSAASGYRRRRTGKPLGRSSGRWDLGSESERVRRLAVQGSGAGPRAGGPGGDSAASGDRAITAVRGPREGRANPATPIGRQEGGGPVSVSGGVTTHQRAEGDQFLPIERRRRPAGGQQRSEPSPAGRQVRRGRPAGQLAGGEGPRRWAGRGVRF